MTWTSDTSKGAAHFLKDALGTDEAIVPFSLESDECCVFAARGRYRHRFIQI